MDTWGDVTGVIVVIAMIRVGWMLARAAWSEVPAGRRGAILDLRAGDGPRG
jgi:hypothetical protein